MSHDALAGTAGLTWAFLSELLPAAAYLALYACVLIPAIDTAALRACVSMLASLGSDSAFVPRCVLALAALAGKRGRV